MSNSAHIENTGVHLYQYIQSVRTSISEELKQLKLVRQERKIRKRLIYLFILDLLPKVCDNIFIFANRHLTGRKIHVYSDFYKIMSLSLLAVLITLLLYGISTFNLMELSSINPSLCLFTFICSLLMDIVFITSFQIFLSEIALPSVITDEVNKAKDVLLTLVSMDNYGNNNKEKSNFNASKYLFVSSNLCKLYPQLPESKAISMYSSNYFPKIVRRDISYSRSLLQRFYNYTLHSLVQCVSLLTTLPHRIVDMLMDIVSIITMYFSVIILVNLFELGFYLGLVAIFVIIIIAAYLYYFTVYNFKLRNMDNEKLFKLTKSKNIRKFVKLESTNNRKEKKTLKEQVVISVVSEILPEATDTNGEKENDDKLSEDLNFIPPFTPIEKEISKNKSLSIIQPHKFKIKVSHSYKFDDELLLQQEEKGSIDNNFSSVDSLNKLEDIEENDIVDDLFIENKESIRFSSPPNKLSSYSKKERDESKNNNNNKSYSIRTTKEFWISVDNNNTSDKKLINHQHTDWTSDANLSPTTKILNNL